MATLKRFKPRRFPVPLVDRQDTELEVKATLNMEYVTLYDPPRDGKTPLDGAGEPQTSNIHATDVKAKLGQGFTLNPQPEPKPEPEPIAAPASRRRR